MSICNISQSVKSWNWFPIHLLHPPAGFLHMVEYCHQSLWRLKTKSTQSLKTSLWQFSNIYPRPSISVTRQTWAQFKIFKSNIIIFGVSGWCMSAPPSLFYSYLFLLFFIFNFNFFYLLCFWVSSWCMSAPPTSFIIILFVIFNFQFFIIFLNYFFSFWLVYVSSTLLLYYYCFCFFFIINF